VGLGLGLGRLGSGGLGPVVRSERRPAAGWPRPRRTPGRARRPGTPVRPNGTRTNAGAGPWGNASKLGMELESLGSLVLGLCNSGRPTAGWPGPTRASKRRTPRGRTPRRRTRGRAGPTRTATRTVIRCAPTWSRCQGCVRVASLTVRFARAPPSEPQSAPRRGSQESISQFVSRDARSETTRDVLGSSPSPLCRCLSGGSLDR
jgi:hypothetical protein